MTVGIHPIGNEDSRSWSAGFGLGGPLVWRQRFSIELDNVIGAVNPGGYAVTRSPLLLDSLRLSVAYRPARHLAIWGAVTGNVLVDLVPSSDGSYRPGYGWGTTLASPGANSPGVKVWPGFAVGLEF
jgi:hypothetical protein